jgi:uncharacterized lipoprotein NlpE involved in copper resistance
MKMKRIIAITAFVFGLTACNNPAATVTTATTTLVKVVDAVQTAAIDTCAFVPTATSIANIVSAGSTAVPSAIANQVCAAVTATKSVTSLMAVPASVNINGKDVPIEGRFVR